MATYDRLCGNSDLGVTTERARNLVADRHGSGGRPRSCSRLSAVLSQRLARCAVAEDA